MERRGRYPPEVRERAVRMVFEQQAAHASQWAAITSIAGKMGCTAGDAAEVGAAGRARRWRAARADDGRAERLKELERENRELRRANEILRKASAYFAQAELDRRAK